MKLSNAIYAIVTIVMLSSCVSVPPTSTSLTRAPIEPEWQVYTRAPIISKQGSDYVVSDQFIVRAGQQQDYLKLLKLWKQHNAIP